MQVEHIVWQDVTGLNQGVGLLDVEIYYHGGGSSDRIIVDGWFEVTDFKTTVKASVLGTVISADTLTGVSAVSVRRIGRIIE